MSRTTELLKKLHTITGRGGRVIGSGRDPVKTRNRAHLAYHERNRKEGKLPGQIRLRLSYGEEASDWFDVLLLSIPELTAIAEKAGCLVKRSVVGEEGLYAVVLEKA